MLCAAVALGVNQEARSQFAMTTMTTIPSPEGAKLALALIDSGAEANFVSQHWLKENLPDLPPGRPHRCKAVDGHDVYSYGQHKISVAATDRNDLTREFRHVFDAVDLSGYDMILGYPWLTECNPDLDWRTRTWVYREASEVSTLSAKQMERELTRKHKAAYLMVPHPTGDAATEGAKLAGSVKMVDAAGGDTNPLQALLDEFHDIFDEKGAGIIPPHATHDHAIELEPGKQPPHRPIYQLSAKELKVLKEYIETSLEKGWIRRSKSPAGAPILFVPKKDGSLRLCVDYRGLNALTIKNRHPLPLISETLDQLATAKVFTQLDLRDAYHRIRIKEGDEWKTAFRTRYGHYEYLVMPFGLVNAPATFQAYINHALSDLLDICVVAYLDDILIYSVNLADHERHVRLVFERLRKYRLYAKPSKCRFHVDTVNFLGFMVSPKGVFMEESRVQSIKDWPEPTCIRDIQVFLGFANFYRRFIREYSRVSAPLTDMTRGANRPKQRVAKFARNRPAAPQPELAAERHSGLDAMETKAFTLTEEARTAFSKLKEAFLTAPLLAHYNPEWETQLETDASGFAISGILSQLNPQEGLWHPVAFWSRKMQPAERNYGTPDQEMLAIFASFQHWRHYLEGSKYPTTVLTDHANLRRFMSTSDLKGRQTRWMEYLSAFDFQIEYRPGAKNPADAPSRRPDYAREVSREPTVLPTLFEKLRRGLFREERTPTAPASEQPERNTT